MKTGLYIHLPFCKQKCNYCDFASFAGQEKRIDDYLVALEKEAQISPIKQFQTLYIGGGTPSLLSSDQIKKLTEIIVRQFGPIGNFEESTFEANPESLTEEKLSVLKQAGFNRISIGLQSFNDAELKTLGRVHNAAQFLHAYKMTRAAGFKNINVDLIAGLPGQTLESFKNSLQQLLDLKPEHLSVYGLQIEEGTKFFEQGIVCDQLLMRKMLEETRDILTAKGYHHYEISNFALPGHEAKHNTHYWNNGEYIGLGSAAASYVKGVRRQNTPDIAAYIEKIERGESPVVFSEKLTGKEKGGETLLLALRKLDGIELSNEQEKMFGAEIKKHLRDGLLERDGKKVKLSREGLFLANEVFCSFVPPFEDL